MLSARQACALKGELWDRNQMRCAGPSPPPPSLIDLNPPSPSMIPGQRMLPGMRLNPGRVRNTPIQTEIPRARKHYIRRYRDRIHDHRHV
eukprot:207776-Prorocentrum_minimum.AAC.2